MTSRYETDPVTGERYRIVTCSCCMGKGTIPEPGNCDEDAPLVGCPQCDGDGEYEA